MTEIELPDGEKLEIPEVNFTGNWLIDAGVLGFTKIMLKVFREQLGRGIAGIKNLQKLSREKPLHLYVGLWPSAFTLYYLETQVKKDISDFSIHDFNKNNDRLSSTYSEIMTDNSGISDPLYLYDAAKNRLKELLEFEKLPFKLKLWIVKKISEKFPSIPARAASEKKIREIIEKREKFLNILVEEDVLPDNAEEISDLLDFLNKSEKISEELLDEKYKDVIESIITHLSRNYPEFERSFLYLNIKVVRKHEKFKFRLKFPWTQEFFTNFAMFNPSTTPKKVFEYSLGEDISVFIRILAPFFRNHKELFRGKIDPLLPFSFDRQISKFLMSVETNSNFFFSKSWHSLHKLVEKLPQFWVYITSALAGFTFIDGHYKFYYHPNLYASYLISEKLDYVAENLSKINEKKNLLREIVFDAVIDALVHTEARFSLYSMYVIEFQAHQQTLTNANFIPFPQYLAAILLDEDLREVLRRSVWIKTDEKYVKCYEILSENLDIIRLAITDIHFYLNPRSNKDRNKGRDNILHSDIYRHLLAIRSTLSDFPEPRNPFDVSYLRFEPVAFVGKIKEKVGRWAYAGKLLLKIFTKEDQKDVMQLLTSIKRGKPHMFVNVILRKLNENRNNFLFNEMNSLTRFLLEEILSTKCWREVALSVLFPLAKKVKTGGGEGGG